uniref:sperm protamine P1-like n=1 Tax=Podarcis muralis TaxID=64176 RepID=UPI00109F50AA|nr:sperm protamine P1-like [Podarcis muralis]
MQTDGNFLFQKGKDKLHGHVKHKRDLEVVDEDVDDLQEEVLDDVVDPLVVAEEEVAQPESGNGHGRGHGRGKGKGKGHHHEHHHGHGKGEGRGRGKGKDKGKKNEVEPVNENEE